MIKGLPNRAEQPSDMGADWDRFYFTTTSWLDLFYPKRTVSVSSGHPAYVTPETRYLLRRRNSAMRKNRAELAAAITSRVGRLIEKQNSSSLSLVNKAILAPGIDR